MRSEPTKTVKGALVTDLVLALFPLNGRLLATGDALSRDEGLSSALWQVLGAVSDGPRTVAQIARVMGLARQSVQRSVNVMKESGLVELAENPDHLTSRLVRMTATGEAAYQQVMRRQTDWSNALGKHLKVDELTVAIRVLHTMLATLEEEEHAKVAK